jgi:hypothetical protein
MQINNFTYQTRLGLPEFIDDGAGNWVPYIFSEDVNSVEIESGLITYKYDKNSCIMSLYNSGMYSNNRLSTKFSNN